MEEETLQEGAFVVVDGLTKSYGANTAIEDVSFSLSPGKVYGLLGPNGAGKSTTMNIMTGYIAASAGTVTIGGHDIFTEAKKAKRHIGYLPENPPLYPDMTTHEYLVFAAELKGIAKDKRLEEVEEVMELTQTVDVSDRLIKNLSKGYKQRVGLAQAILNDPEVIILDEPTVGLDPQQINEFRQLIRSLGEEHIVILSSHIMQEISAVCDHVFIIANGKLVVDDATENLGGHIKSGQKLSITAKGDGDTAVTAISALENVSDVTFETAGEDGKIQIFVTSEEGADVKEAVSLALMQQQIPIFGMEEQSSTLESIFLEVMKESEEESEGEDEEGTEEESAVYDIHPDEVEDAGISEEELAEEALSAPDDASEASDGTIGESEDLPEEQKEGEE